MDNFLSYQYIATFVGMVFTVGMATEFIKEIKFIKNVPTKYLTCVVAFVLILTCDLVIGTFKLVNIPLAMLNSILITFTATGSYDFNKKLKNNETIDDKTEIKQ